MGGVDKGLMPFLGRPLVAHVLERLAPQVEAIVVSANRHRDQYAALGWPVVADSWPERAGPLAGVLAAGRFAASGHLLVAPCDMPLLPHNLARRLADAAAAANRPLARAVDAKRVHYTLMWLNRALLDDLEAYLAAGGRAVRDWQARHAPVDVRFEDARVFCNLNDAAALAALEARLAGRIE